MLRRLICVLLETRMPAARIARIASSAARCEPCTPRRRSWVASLPSIETLTLSMPAALACCARSAFMPRPPVVIVGDMPKRLSSRTIVKPILAQVGFAADERDLAHAELGHLPHQIQTLRRAQLVTAFVPGARAAVSTGQIALQRDLPDRVDRARLFVHRTRIGRERQLPAGARRVRRDRQLSRSRPQHLLRPLLRSHRILSRHLPNASRTRAMGRPRTGPRAADHRQKPRKPQA